MTTAHFHLDTSRPDSRRSDESWVTARDTAKKKKADEKKSNKGSKAPADKPVGEAKPAAKSTKK